MGSQGWPGRVWMTLHEPRWVTAAMVGVYGALVKMTVTILSSPGGTSLDVVLGCLLLAVGGGIGERDAEFKDVEAGAAGGAENGKARFGVGVAGGEVADEGFPVGGGEVMECF